MIRMTKTRAASRKAQSAMEYLMTYGWAILIIAVVLGLLFQFGVFSSNTFAPRAQPGQCYVSRPSGAGTVQYINLAGVCNNMMPKYVARFDGQSSVVDVGSSPALLPDVFTVTAWIKTGRQTPTSSNSMIVGFSGSSGRPAIELNGSADRPLIYMGNANYRYFNNAPVDTGDANWHFIAFVVTGNGQNDISNSVMYADGQAETVAATTLSNTPSTKQGPLYIGAAYGGSHFNGSIANVQLYNASLSANDITSLYDEGIGGAPINLHNLVGWWPLNGDSKDYSGNGNNGAATDVLYSGAWTSGYTAPS